MASGTRNWKFVVWQESAPDDFVQRMANSFMKVNMCLHDKDHHADGTPVKPHWDCVLMLDGPMPYDKVLEKVKSVAGDGCNTVQECISVSGALRYICHLSNTDYNDDTEKYPYDPKNVISLNGAQYVRDMIRYQDPDDYDHEIMHWIDKYNITQYKDLIDYAVYFQPQWERNVKTRTIFWKGYLTSKEDKQKNNVYSPFDDLIKEMRENGN